MPLCYFCVLETESKEKDGVRSDALRKHCVAKHTAADVVDKVLPNSYKFRRDTDRPNLLLSLKTEGSKENCGYCFDCHTQIPMPSGQCPNKIAYIQQHQCREVKPRAKRTVVSGGAGAASIIAQVAPIHKLTEERINEYHKLITEDFRTIMPALRTMGIWEANEAGTVDLKRSEANIYKALVMTTQGLKDNYAAKSTTVSTTGGFIIENLLDEYAIQCNKAKFASRGRLLRDHYKQHHDKAEAEAAEDEDSIYIKSEVDKEWLFDLWDVFIAPKKIDSTELFDSQKALDQLTMAHSDMKAQLYAVTQNAIQSNIEINRLQEENRKMRTLNESLIREKIDTINHTV
jgi:hypothetical protein